MGSVTPCESATVTEHYAEKYSLSKVRCSQHYSSADKYTFSVAITKRIRLVYFAKIRDRSLCLLTIFYSAIKIRIFLAYIFFVDITTNVDIFE